jgi:thymidylate kinase
VIVHINGWPGVGKLTVAREVTRRLGGRLLDNHTVHDVAIRLCDRGTAEYWDLYYRVRDLAYARVRAMPSGQTVVMTNALLAEDARDGEAWQAIKRLAADRAETLVSVTIACSLEENVRRLRSDDRRDRKMVDAEPLMEWRSTYTLLTDDTIPSLTIDNTSRSPDHVADDIVNFVGQQGRVTT